MFFIDQKLENRTNELNEFRYRDKIDLKSFLVKEDKEGIVNPEVPKDFAKWEELEVGSLWKGRDKYLWLHKDILIPKEWKEKKVVGIFDFGKTGAGNNSGFESLLYIEEDPYQGVDSNHKEVFLKKEMIGETINFTFRLWSGLEGGGVPKEQEHRIERADLAWLDEKVDDFYYISTMIVDTLKNLDDNNPIRHTLRTTLDNAFKLIDWSYPGSEEFYQSIYKADDKLNQEIDKMDKSSLVTVKCVGHTHIDVAWLWTLKNTREKCSRSFSTVLRLMELYPEYIFLQTQPQLYEYIKEDFPEIYEKIKERVKNGQWEVDGGMWVEADCNLTSGESLTRQILIGTKFIKDEFNKEVEYLWLPDVFGYSWALPQILKKSGINMFMTTKISWNQYNRMPHDTFLWKGIDGSEVITHFITTPDPWSEPGSWFYTYNGKLTPKTVKGVWDAYSEKDWNKDLLISYGYGDGGGGVNRDMLEQRRRIDKLPGLPNLKTSTASEYFKELKETVKHADQQVPTWDGELYLEYHRGTYTSHAYNKKMNRQMEFLYREAEWLTVLAAIEAKELAQAEQETLTTGWKILLTNQFHDIIPGSSINDVYKVSKIDYEKAEQIALSVEQNAIEKLLQKEENTYTIVNNGGWKRDDLVKLEKVEGIFKDGNGNTLKSQQGDNCTYVEVKQIPAMGFQTITLAKEEKVQEEIPFTITKDCAETPFYRLEWNKYGQIIKLYDKENDREVLPEGQKANVFQIFEDKPLGNDAWDIDIFYQEKMREVIDLQEIEIVEVGQLRATIRMKWNYMNSIIKQDIILYANNRRIDFQTMVDYHEVHQLLKVAFPVDVRAVYATYDVQYGNVKRPNHWNTSWDQARFETVAHRWVDLSEYNYGVSLLNDCKYGHDIKDNIIRLTLLKAANHPDHLQDLGEHFFTYSLLPHASSFVEGETVKEAFALNQPLKALKGKRKEVRESFLTIDNEFVELDAVKKSEDGNYIVIRFHEYTGSKQKVNISLNFDYEGFMESDLMERPIEEMHKEREIKLQVKPFEIKTILIKL